MAMAAVRLGKAKRMRNELMKVATVKRGICQRPMPLARKRRHVTMKLIAAMMDEAPSTASEIVQNVTPSCGEYAIEVSGA